MVWGSCQAYPASGPGSYGWQGTQAAKWHLMFYWWRLSNCTHRWNASGGPGLDQSTPPTPLLWPEGDLSQGKSPLTQPNQLQPQTWEQEGKDPGWVCLWALLSAVLGGWALDTSWAQHQREQGRCYRDLPPYGEKAARVGGALRWLCPPSGEAD